MNTAPPRAAFVHIPRTAGTAFGRMLESVYEGRAIANFYAAPASKAEFLLGKQLPYMVVALIQFATLVLLAVLLFQVPIKGSIGTLVLGGVLYVLASTGFGRFRNVLR